MSLNINTNKVNNEIKILDKYIKEYKDNNYDLYFELSKLDNCWKGEDATFFMDKIKEEKTKNINLISSLENLSNYYKNVSSLYDNIQERK